MQVKNITTIIYSLGKYGLKWRGDAQTGEIKGKKEKWSYRLLALPTEFNRCQDAVQPDVSQQDKAPFSNVMTCTMVYFMFAEKANMHYMYGRSNGNGRATLRMYHAQFRDR